MDSNNSKLDQESDDVPVIMVDSDECMKNVSINEDQIDCLEKIASSRTEDDIKILLDLTRELKAFSHMTDHNRRRMCEVMVFAVVPQKGTVVMKHGEELDSWSVVLQGTVEIVRPGGSTERLRMGDSFGVHPSLDKQYHQGVMRTMENDCYFICIEQSSFYEIFKK